MKLNLQFFGGRGAGSGGESLSSGGGSSIKIESQTDVWSFRHNKNNERFVDEINNGVRKVQGDFPDIMDSVDYVNASKLSPKDADVLGYYGGREVALNARYTDVDKMNKIYDRSTKDGFHPSRGNLSGTQAVAIHEMGHALTDHIAPKMGAKSLDAAAKRIVNDAYKNSKGKGGTKKWAGKISGYAQSNYAECVAEAIADYYCNGDKASSQAKAIMTEMFKYR